MCVPPNTVSSRCYFIFIFLSKMRVKKSMPEGCRATFLLRFYLFICFFGLTRNIIRGKPNNPSRGRWRVREYFAASGLPKKVSRFVKYCDLIKPEIFR